MNNIKHNLLLISFALLAGTASAQDAMGSMAPHDAMKATAAKPSKMDPAMSKSGDHMMANHAMAASAPATDTGHMMAAHAPATDAMSGDTGHMMAGHAMAASSATGK